jgi:ppGpp synthetase/RelA/SpoT-type nucleotidyltranferase
MTRSQVERLGERLLGSRPPAASDLEALHDVLVIYADALADAVAIVHDGTGLVPTSRVKNTGTILEKLDRYGGSWLKSIQDLAGMRIVGGFDRDGQDQLVERLVALFDHGGRSPRLVDRREHPVQGYTAVHVVVFVDDLPVEIQVRTRLQHEWADLFEKLADRVGRGIRYGEPPTHWLTEDERQALPTIQRERYVTQYEIVKRTVELAKAVGEQIRLFEVATHRFPDNEHFRAYGSAVTANLADLRARLGRLDWVRARASPSTSN